MLQAELFKRFIVCSVLREESAMGDPISGGLRERLAAGVTILEIIDRKRRETGDVCLGAYIEHEVTGL